MMHLSDAPNLVSPVEVGEGAYVAAATTVTENVPKTPFCIGRSRMTTKEIGYVIVKF